MKVTANYLFSGMIDYFGGYGCKGNEALLYAFYGYRTTLRDIIDEWVEDSWNGAACEDVPESVTQEDIRAALLDMLTDAGRADYANNAIAECAEAMEVPCCPDCGALVDEMHCEGCDKEDTIVDEEDCDVYDSPITVVVIEWEEDDV
jgi:hypothetical protein